MIRYWVVKFFIWVYSGHFFASNVLYFNSKCGIIIAGAGKQVPGVSLSRGVSLAGG